MTQYALVADIGGTKIAAARVSSHGVITHSLRASTPGEGGKAVIKVILQLLDSLPRDGVTAIGADVPGLAYPNGSVWAPNIRGWVKIPLGDNLKHHFKLPALVESDRNAFVTGEAWRGAARNCRDVVFLAIGTGIGAGIISGGRLLRGHAELAGSIGWMAVRDRFLPPYDTVGCLESHVAGPAIGTAGTNAFGSDVNAREVVRRARRGDRAARRILYEAGHYLGLALANLVSLLNPEIIVVGGGVAAAGNLLLGPARATMRRWAQPLAVRQVRVVRSSLGSRAGLLGIARLAFLHVERKALGA